MNNYPDVYYSYMPYPENNKPENPLLLGVRTNNIDMVKSALENGENVNVCDDLQRDSTPLRIACREGYIEIIKLLLEQPDIDINATNLYDIDTILIDLCQYEDDDICDKHVEAIKLLLSHPKIDVNHYNDCEFNALHYACENKHIEVIKLLLKHPDIDVNFNNSLGPYVSKEIYNLFLNHPKFDKNNNDITINEYDY